MRRYLVPITALVVLVSALPAAAQTTGNVQFLIGQRWLGDEWEAVDEPSVFGVEVDFAPQKSPVHVALGVQLSGDDSTLPGPISGDDDVDVGFFELSAGFLWHPVKQGVARPYIGGGVLTMSAAIASDFVFFDADEADQSFGFYGNLGMFFKVGERFNIGVDGRIVRGTEFEFAGSEIDADYEQAALLIGFSWGP